MARYAKKCHRLFCLLVVATVVLVFFYMGAGLSCYFKGGKCSSKSEIYLFGGTALEYVPARKEFEERRVTALKNDSDEVIIPPKMEHSLSYPVDQVPVYSTYAEAVEARANEDRLIILSSLDKGYVDMALNLWETSFLKFSISNFLFVCTDEDAVALLKERGIPCFLGFKLKSSTAQSSYGSAAFKEKTHIKTKIILDALDLGYDVLIVDVDIVFLKNPIPFFDCDQCDIQIQDDGPEINSGFYYVRPTKSAIKLHSSSLELAHRSRGLSNQQCLNRVLKNMRQQKAIKAKVLEDQYFPRGQVYFENGKRMFADDPSCDTCVIVHNNWIVGGAAKIYRFKEFSMWMIDHDGYYSSNSTKYIYYNNYIHIPGKDTTQRLEIDTLKIALTLGKALGRKVILPAFHCDGCSYGACKNPSGRCSLNTHINIKTFDQHLSHYYREHMFLKHPKVPQTVKESLSPVFLIQSDAWQKYRDDHSMNLLQPDKVLKPKDPSGASRSEILQWFGDDNVGAYRVLRFHSLYSAYKLSEDPDFQMILASGLKRSTYRQY